jgi:alpha-N-acetylglucosamine transferase
MLHLLYMKLVNVDVRFITDFGFNCNIRIYKEHHETQILELKTQLIGFRHVYLLETTVT